jgi:hypothetical protein
MIIKRWNGSAFVKEFPETKAQLIRNNADDDFVFDSNDKIKPNYLPNSVFDSLYYYDVIDTNKTLETIGQQAISSSTFRKAEGYYWVATANVTVSFSSTPTLIGGKYYGATLRPSEEGGALAGSGSEILETGDWIILTTVGGQDGATGPTAIQLSFAIVNNTYENATTALNGIVRLSSQTAYADLSGNNVVTDGRLKTLIDNASFALSGHTHGNIDSDGQITATSTPATGQSFILSGATNQLSRSSLVLGTSTTTYLTNAGTWATPTGTYTHPAYSTRSVDTDGVEVLDTFTSDATGHVTGIAKRTLPNATTSAAGVMSSTDKTKLDGIATGANAYVHPTYTYSTPSADAQTTLANVQLISTLTQTNGHVTGGTARKLVAGTNVSITAASDGNITISSTDTNTVATVTALGGLSATSNSFQMVHPFFVQADAPATPLAGTIWFDL